MNVHEGQAGSPPHKGRKGTFFFQCMYKGAFVLLVPPQLCLLCLGCALSVPSRVQDEKERMLGLWTGKGQLCLWDLDVNSWEFGC